MKGRVHYWPYRPPPLPPLQGTMPLGVATEGYFLDGFLGRRFPFLWVWLALIKAHSLVVRWQAADFPLVFGLSSEFGGLFRVGLGELACGAMGYGVDCYLNHTLC